MDTAILVTGLASAAFVASHLGLASTPSRDRLVARLGENCFSAGSCWPSRGDLVMSARSG
jgi:hypothetical protein